MDSQTAQPGCEVLLLGFEEWENLGLRSIAAFLLRQGIRARIEPLSASKEEILAVIRRDRPEIVGFSLIFQNA